MPAPYLHPCGLWSNDPVFKNLYSRWSSMHRRCKNPKVWAYQYYGGRGICVCPEWETFSGFLSWALFSGYAPELELDRINPDAGYSPDNCRWSTGRENRAHRRITPKLIAASLRNSRRVDRAFLVQRGIETRRKNVKCVETGEVFLACVDADRKLGLADGSVYHAAARGGRTKGFHWELL